MTKFQTYVLIILGLWLLLSVIFTIAIYTIINHIEKKNEKKRAEFEKRWNRYGR